MTESLSLRQTQRHGIHEYEALRQTHEHGEFRVKKDGTLYVAKDGFLGRKMKGLELGSGAKTERAAARTDFREALATECGSDERAGRLLGTATRSHPDRLNVKDFDRIWAEVRLARGSDEASSSGSAEHSAPAQGSGHTTLDVRSQLTAQRGSPDGERAMEHVETALAGVAKDDRLGVLLDENHLSLRERVVDHGLGSKKFYAGLVPVLGAAIKFADSRASSTELVALKSLREDRAATHGSEPLLNACLDVLEDHNRVKRDKNGASAALDLAARVATAPVGGLGGVVVGAAGNALGHLASLAVTKGVDIVAGKAADIGATKAAQARADHHVDHLQAKTGLVLGSGDQARRLDDYHSVRALLLYLGPADQRAEIAADRSLTPKKRDELLAQEDDRLALKGMLGSEPSEDLTKASHRDKDDQRYVAELGKRGTKGNGAEKYGQLRDNDEAEAPSPLKTLWMLEGWIGTDNKAEQLVTATKDKVDGLKVRAQTGASYQKL